LSDLTRWTIGTLITVIGMSIGFRVWRKRQLRSQLKFPDNSALADSFWKTHSMLFSWIALGIAGLAQYALRINQTGFAALGYGVAVILFLGALYQFVPITQIYELKVDDPQPSSTNTSPTHPKPAFLKAWWNHFLTKRRKPNPSLTIKEKLRLQTPFLTIKPQTIPLTGTVAKATTTSNNDHSSPIPAQIAIWSGFTQPESILIAADGQILIMDVSQQTIYHLNQNGEIVRQWSIPPLPESNGHNMALSPDGRHLYITDTREGLIYVVTLED